ncbi:MAG: hypothetical protein AVDCRST_MAG83-1582 [uncultured Arthrobacter sp.]|uniref:Uncharacterized protein n=1 Tax=uncultured Arthrobacter sp. TaxID=114050 RepID=A0A6J4I1E5_9MICC|nr:MAG: hypothetical protein AVDCRST_MAG83-1582 [uncultured Arthrobacter sp.]
MTDQGRGGGKIVFEVEGELRLAGLGGGGPRLVDRGRDATFSQINGSAAGGSDLFHLMWRGLSIPVVAFKREAVNPGSGEAEIHIHITAVGKSRYAARSELKASRLSGSIRDAAHQLAAEALLIFGSWGDGLSFPDGYFAVEDNSIGKRRRYTMSSFGYTGASRPPNYSRKLKATEESIRRQAIEESWGLSAPDAVFVIVLHNHRRAMVSYNDHMRVAVEAGVPDLGPEELTKLQERADRLASNSSRYGTTHLDGESVESVISTMSADAPGFSHETYRRALAYGTFVVQRNRDSEREYRVALIEQARSYPLLDAVFTLVYFNQRFSRRQFLGAIPLHEALGDLHPSGALDDARVRATELIQEGSHFAWTPEETKAQQDYLRTRHPGFSTRCIDDALDGGYQQNR